MVNKSKMINYNTHVTTDDSKAPVNAYWQSKTRSMLNDFNVGNYDHLGDYGRLDKIGASHTDALRQRYPMLTELLLNGNASKHANLSSPENTDKYARLADAYNARYKWTPNVQMSGNPFDDGAGGSFGAGTLQAINPINTQDLRQMDVRRQGEGKLQDYTSNEESYFQRKIFDEKMREQWNILTQEQKEAFFKKDEEMNRIKKLFDSFARLSEEDYNKYRDEIGIPFDQVKQIHSMLNSNDPQAMWMATTMLDKYHMSPQGAENIMKNMALGEATKAAANGDAYGAAHELAKTESTFMVSKIDELIKVAETKSEIPELRNAVTAMRSVLNGATGLATWTGSHPQMAVLIAFLGSFINNFGSELLARFIAKR